MIATCLSDGTIVIKDKNVNKISFLEQLSKSYSFCHRQSASEIENASPAPMKFFHDNPMNVKNNSENSKHQCIQSNSKVYLQEQIQITLENFEHSKFCYFLGSVAIHAPWIVALFLFHQNIVYHPKNEDFM